MREDDKEQMREVVDYEAGGSKRFEIKQDNSILKQALCDAIARSRQPIELTAALQARLKAKDCGRQPEQAAKERPAQRLIVRSFEHQLSALSDNDNSASQGATPPPSAMKKPGQTL